MQSQSDAHCDVPSLGSTAQIQRLSVYRTPAVGRSLFEVITLVPFLVVFATAWGALTISHLLSVLVLIAALGWLGGLQLILVVYLPTTVLAAAIGMWLFYVQHQFEETSWDQDEDRSVTDAGLQGPSYYLLPSVLNWITASIGMHHVHHLTSRIPFYRLPEVLRDNCQISDLNRLTLRESLGVRLTLWDEERRKLISPAEARRLIEALALRLVQHLTKACASIRSTVYESSDTWMILGSVSILTTFS